MVLRAVRNTLLLLLMVFCVACAPQAVVLRPGNLPLVVHQPGEGQGLLWVSGARDVRRAEKAGPKVGTLYSRFEKAPQMAYLEPRPEIYVKNQLARYLFNVGLEAPGADVARGLVTVDLEDFSLSEVPGSVWDEISVRVAYTVRIRDRSGQELAKVRLEGTQQIQTPVDVEKKVEAAFRDALNDTFHSLSRSDAFRRALANLRG